MDKIENIIGLGLLVALVVAVIYGFNDVADTFTEATDSGSSVASNISTVAGFGILGSAAIIELPAIAVVGGVGLAGYGLYNWAFGD